MTPSTQKTFVVEHLDPELEAWSALEYQTIAEECSRADARFVLSSVSPTLQVPRQLRESTGVHIETLGVEELFASCKQRVCLLDPGGEHELSPGDAERFDVFLFGGILGDDPPRDRTSELRKKGYQGRRLGPVQMTTDTAVRTTMKVVLTSTPINAIPYVDHPEIQIDKHESTQMPFRYIIGSDNKPVMPKGMIELIKQDAEKGFADLL